MKKLLFILSIMALAGCQQAENHTYETAEKNPSMTQKASMDKSDYRDVISSPSLEAFQSIDSSKKFIRTGVLRFKCKDVLKTTQAIENLVIEAKGFVSQTSLETNEVYSRSIQTSQDSMTNILKYTMKNTMMLRIPNRALDETLKKISKEIAFLDSRNLSANDITLQLYAELLKQQRLQQYQQRQSNNIEETTGTLEQQTYAEDELLEKRLEEDQSALKKLELKDQIAYSTISLSIYSPELTQTTQAYIPENTPPYTPPFLEELSKSITSGWSLLKSLLLMIVNIWPLILLLGSGVFMYKKWAKAKG